MDLSAEKCLVMVLLTILSIILGLIPYFIIRYTKSSLSMNSNRYHLFLTILSCFGAGVLLSTALLHVLPEVREASSNISEIRNTFDDHFPVAEMLVLAGFCMIYLVEEVAHFIMVDGHRGHRHHHRQRNTIARHTSIAHGIPMVNSSTRRPSLTISMSDEGNIIVNVVARPSTQPDLPDIQSSTSSLQNNGQYEEECPDEKSTLTSSFRASVALLALSFHGVVEGIAIGLQVRFTIPTHPLHSIYYSILGTLDA
jgi:zinc transporter 1/2/3